MSPDLNHKMLSPIEGLDFDADSHRYRYNGQWLNTSPTTVLSWDMEEHAKKRIEETRHEWEPRGNMVHLWLEHHLTGAAQIDPGEYLEWVQPLQECWLFRGCKVLASELRLVNPKKNMGGSVDFLIVTKRGTVTVGDLKTVKSYPSLQRRKPATAQLGAYIEMLQINYPLLYIEKAVTVVAAPGQTKVLASEPDECLEAWDKAWNKYQISQDLLGF